MCSKDTLDSVDVESLGSRSADDRKGDDPDILWVRNGFLNPGNSRAAIKALEGDQQLKCAILLDPEYSRVFSAQNTLVVC